VRVAGALAIALAVATAAAPPGHAQPAGGKDTEEPNADEVARGKARELFGRGKALHEAGDYLAAAEIYLEAYRTYPAAAFLYNAAQVFRLGGDRHRALEHYRQYLALEPDGPASADAREFIATLEQAEASGARDEPADQATREEPKSAAIDPLDDPAVAVVRPLRARPGRGKRIAGVVALAGGGAAIGASIFFGLRAADRSDQLSRFDGTWGPAQDELYREGESAERAMILLGAVGAASIVAGGALYLWGAREDGAVVVHATAVPGGAGLAARGRF
jgi:tetratricopeptide (TPR) repeat protein